MKRGEMTEGDSESSKLLSNMDKMLNMYNNVIVCSLCYGRMN